ncbi:MAG: acetate--CoA ligase [Thaumarchaeota archaeon]|nr:MAG: acetate--CoA ligase [Nitrososphaerota archaeon]
MQILVVLPKVRLLTGGFAIGRPDEIKGEAITLFVVVKDGLAADYNLTDEIVKIAGESIQSQDLSMIENPWWPDAI